MRSLLEDDRPKEKEIELSPNGNSLDFLQLVYRNSALPLHTRMRAAMAALKHEVPALLATAIVNENSFAELLDQRIKRMNDMKLIEPVKDNGKPINGGGGADARLPPTIPDRRYRRF